MSGFEIEHWTEELGSASEGTDVFSSRIESLHNIQILPAPSTLKLTTILVTPTDEISTSMYLFEAASSFATALTCFEISVQMFPMRPAKTDPLSGIDTLWISGPSNVIARSNSAKRESCNSCFVLLRSCRQSFGVHIARICELWRLPWGLMNRWRIPLLLVLPSFKKWSDDDENVTQVESVSSKSITARCESKAGCIVCLKSVSCNQTQQLTKWSWIEILNVATWIAIFWSMIYKIGHNIALSNWASWARLVEKYFFDILERQIVSSLSQNHCFVSVWPSILARKVPMLRETKQEDDSVWYPKQRGLRFALAIVGVFAP